MRIGAGIGAKTEHPVQLHWLGAADLLLGVVDDGSQRSRTVRADLRRLAPEARVVMERASDLPTRWQGFDTLDCLVLSEEAARVFSTRQSIAIQQWTTGGGAVLIVKEADGVEGPDRPARALDRGLPETEDGGGGPVAVSGGVRQTDGGLLLGVVEEQTVLAAEAGDGAVLVASSLDKGRSREAVLSLLAWLREGAAKRRAARRIGHELRASQALSPGPVGHWRSRGRWVFATIAVLLLVATGARGASGSRHSMLLLTSIVLGVSAGCLPLSGWLAEGTVAVAQRTAVEGQTQSPWAQAVTVIDVSSSARSNVTLRLRGSMVLPEVVGEEETKGRKLTVEFGGGAGTGISLLTVPGRTFSLRCSQVVPSPLLIEVASEGEAGGMEMRRHSSVDLENGFVLWRDRGIRLPSIPTGKWIELHRDDGFDRNRMRFDRNVEGRLLRRIVDSRPREDPTLFAWVKAPVLSVSRPRGAEVVGGRTLFEYGLAEIGRAHSPRKVVTPPLAAGFELESGRRKSSLGEAGRGKAEWGQADQKENDLGTGRQSRSGK